MIESLITSKFLTSKGFHLKEPDKIQMREWRPWISGVGHLIHQRGVKPRQPLPDGFLVVV